MRVDADPAGRGQGLWQSRPGHPAPASKPAEDPGQAALVPAAEEQDTVEFESDEGGQRGVIRLLEAGHFKGVADLRLRINFHDELAARAGAAGTQTATDGTAALSDQVTAQAQELIGGWGLDEESQAAADDLLTQFESATQAALGESVQDGKIDTTRLADLLRTAFQTFAGGLAGLAPAAGPVEPPAGDTAEDGTSGSPAADLPADMPAGTDTPAPAETVPTSEASTAEAPVVDGGTSADTQAQPPPQPVGDASGDPAPSLDPRIEPLAQFFADELTNLLTSVADAGQLPPLTSEPSGHGKAYDKFLAIYHGLNGQTPQAEPTGGDDESVDVVG